MKYVRILCAVALVFALCSAFTMKDKEKAVYAFGGGRMFFIGTFGSRYAAGCNQESG